MKKEYVYNIIEIGGDTPKIVDVTKDKVKASEIATENPKVWRNVVKKEVH